MRGVEAGNVAVRLMDLKFFFLWKKELKMTVRSRKKGFKSVGCIIKIILTQILEVRVLCASAEPHACRKMA